MRVRVWGTASAHGRLHEALVQDLARVEQAVAHLGQHQPEGVLDGDDIPELHVVLLLALVRQRVLDRRLLRVHRLCQRLHRIEAPSQPYCNTGDRALHTCPDVKCPYQPAQAQSEVCRTCMPFCDCVHLRVNADMNIVFHTHEAWAGTPLPQVVSYARRQTYSRPD